MSDDLIKREDAIEALQKEINKGIPPFDDTMGAIRCGVRLARNIIEDLPSADRPQGEWIEMYRNGFGNMICMCSKCSFHASRSRYCPNCGMRMKGEGDDI